MTAFEHINRISNKKEPIHYESGFAVFNGWNNIELGSNIYLVDSLINAGDTIGRVVIEDNVFFGHGVKILARGHDYHKKGALRQTTITEKPILIKNGAWIASGCIVLGGVVIGANSVIGAGSVVTHSVFPGEIVAGNPAKHIKWIDDLSPSKMERLKLLVLGRRKYCETEFLEFSRCSR